MLESIPCVFRHGWIALSTKYPQLSSLEVFVRDNGTFPIDLRGLLSCYFTTESLTPQQSQHHAGHTHRTEAFTLHGGSVAHSSSVEDEVLYHYGLNTSATSVHPHISQETMHLLVQTMLTMIPIMTSSTSHPRSAVRNALIQRSLSSGHIQRRTRTQTQQTPTRGLTRVHEQYKPRKIHVVVTHAPGYVLTSARANAPATQQANTKQTNNQPNILTHTCAMAHAHRYTTPITTVLQWNSLTQPLSRISMCCPCACARDSACLLVC